MGAYKRKIIALAALISTIAVLFLLSPGSIAARKKVKIRKVPSAAAARGAGSRPSATAVNVGKEAWIYTNNFASSTPTQTTGSIDITAISAAKPANDRANVVTRFKWKGASYTVRMACPFAVSGEDFPNHGAVQFLRPVFGSSDLGPLNLPQTTAQVAVFARATISRNGKEIANNQPAIAVVSQAIHGPNQELLSSADSNNREIGLIIPGPLYGQKFVRGFPNGYFYIYWPNVNLKMQNVKPTKLTSPPMRTGRGPVKGRIGTQTVVGTINISLTNTGIKQQVNSAPMGLYNLTITNNSSRPRGVVYTGLDLCCSEYTRFSNILSPGGSQSFRWYFAPGTVTFKDFLEGRKTATGFSNVRFGGHTSMITFQ